MVTLPDLSFLEAGTPLVQPLALAATRPQGSASAKFVALTDPEGSNSSGLRIEVEVWPDDKPADVAMHDRPVAEVTEVLETVSEKLASLRSPSEPTYRCRVVVNGTEMLMDVVDPTPELAPQVVSAVTHVLLTYTTRQMI